MAWRRNCLHCQSCERKEWQRRRRRSSTGVSCSRRRWPRGPESWQSSVSPLSLCHPQSLGGRNPFCEMWRTSGKSFWSWTLSKRFDIVHGMKLYVRHKEQWIWDTAFCCKYILSCKTFLILWPLFWSFLKKGVLNKHTSCFENLFEPYWVSFYFHRK